MAFASSYRVSEGARTLQPLFLAIRERQKRDVRLRRKEGESGVVSAVSPSTTDMVMQSTQRAIRSIGLYPMGLAVDAAIHVLGLVVLVLVHYGYVAGLSAVAVTLFMGIGAVAGRILTDSDRFLDFVPLLCVLIQCLDTAFYEAPGCVLPFVANLGVIGLGALIRYANGKMELAATEKQTPQQSQLQNSTATTTHKTTEPAPQPARLPSYLAVKPRQTDNEQARPNTGLTVTVNSRGDSGTSDVSPTPSPLATPRGISSGSESDSSNTQSSSTSSKATGPIAPSGSSTPQSQINTIDIGELEKEIRESLRQELRKELLEKTRAEIKEEIRQELERDLRADIEQELRRVIRQEALEEIAALTRSNVDNSLNQSPVSRSPSARASSTELSGAVDEISSPVAIPTEEPDSSSVVASRRDSSPEIAAGPKPVPDVLSTPLPSPTALFPTDEPTPDIQQNEAEQAEESVNVNLSSEFNASLENLDSSIDNVTSQHTQDLQQSDASLLTQSNCSGHVTQANESPRKLVSQPVIPPLPSCVVPEVAPNADNELDSVKASASSTLSGDARTNTPKTSQLSLMRTLKRQFEAQEQALHARIAEKEEALRAREHALMQRERNIRMQRDEITRARAALKKQEESLKADRAELEKERELNLACAADLEQLRADLAEAAQALAREKGALAEKAHQLQQRELELQREQDSLEETRKRIFQMMQDIDARYSQSLAESNSVSIHDAPTQSDNCSLSLYAGEEERSSVGSHQ